MDEQISSQNARQVTSINHQNAGEYVVDQCTELQKTGGIITISVHTDTRNPTELVTDRDNILYTVNKTTHPLVTAFITKIIESTLTGEHYCLEDSKSITGYSLTIHPYNQLPQQDNTKPNSTSLYPRLLSPYNEQTSFGVITTEENTYKTDLPAHSPSNTDVITDTLTHVQNRKRTYAEQTTTETVVEITLKQHPIPQSIAQLCGIIEGLELTAKTVTGHQQIDANENLHNEEFIDETVPATRFQWILNALTTRSKTISTIADAAQTTTRYAKANIKLLESVNIVQEKPDPQGTQTEYTLTDEFLDWQEKTKFNSVTEAQVNYILRKNTTSYTEQISNAYHALTTLTLQ